MCRKILQIQFIGKRHRDLCFPKTIPNNPSNFKRFTFFLQLLHRWFVGSLLLCCCWKSDAFVGLLYSSREKGKQTKRKTETRGRRQRGRRVYLYALAYRRPAMMDVHVIFTSFFIFASSFLSSSSPPFSSFTRMGLFLSFIRLLLLFESKRRDWRYSAGLSFRSCQRPTTTSSLTTNSSIDWRRKRNWAGLEQTEEP